MASLKDAEQARSESADLLRDLGAHAISVEPDLEDLPTEPTGSAPAPAEPASSPTKVSSAKPKPASRRRIRYAVVAWFDGEPPESVPSQIHVEHRRGSAAVPVKIRRSEPFRPEPTSADEPESTQADEPKPDVFRPE
jgi:hypothetical protein